MVEGKERLPRLSDETRDNRCESLASLQNLGKYLCGVSRDPRADDDEIAKPSQACQDDGLEPLAEHAPRSPQKLHINVGGAKTSATGRRPPPSFPSFRILVVTLNEGELPLTASRVKAAVSASARALCPDDLAAVEAVVVARQEAHDKNLDYWREALSLLGFLYTTAEAELSNMSRIHIFSREPDSFKLKMESTIHSQVPGLRRTSDGAASKGAVAVFVEHHGLKLCFACCHLDSKLVDEQRLAPLAAVIAEACKRTNEEIDAVFIMGDINSTMSPTAQALRDDSPSHRAASSLQVELETCSVLAEETGVYKITEGLKDRLLNGLSTPKGREEMYSMDGNPMQIVSMEHQQGAITAVNLVPMATSTFPTYRLCNADEATLQKFRQAGCGSEDPGVFFMRTHLELSPENIQQCYFHDKKGHSGAIKKRGDMVRLGLGWLDRLYIGLRDVDSIVATDVKQGVPVWLFSEDMKNSVDHNLIPWLVTFQNELTL